MTVRRTQQIIFISFYLLIFICFCAQVETCHTQYKDAGSLAYLSEITVEGVVLRKPAPINNLAHIRVKTVHKEKPEKHITLRKIQVKADQDGPCSVRWQAKQKLILFLNSTTEERVFTLFAPPVSANRRNKKALKKVICAEGACAKVPSVKGLKSQSILEGASVKLRCKIRSPLPTTLVWLKDGVPLGRREKGAKVKISRRGTSGSITIPKAAVYHTGTYQCKATTVAGLGVKEARLEVLRPTEEPTTQKLAASGSIEKLMAIDTPDNHSVGYYEKCSGVYVNYCLNSGTCYRVTDTQFGSPMFCRCKSGYGGDRCEYRDPILVLQDYKSKEEQYRDRVITATALIIGLLVLVGVFVLAWYKSRSKRAKFQRKRDSRRSRQEEPYNTAVDDTPGKHNGKDYYKPMDQNKNRNNNSVELEETTFALVGSAINEEEDITPEPTSVLLENNPEEKETLNEVVDINFDRIPQVLQPPLPSIVEQPKEASIPEESEPVRWPVFETVGLLKFRKHISDAANRARRDVDDRKAAQLKNHEEVNAPVEESVEETRADAANEKSQRKQRLSTFKPQKSRSLEEQESFDFNYGSFEKYDPVLRISEGESASSPQRDSINMYSADNGSCPFRETDIVDDDPPLPQETTEHIRRESSSSYSSDSSNSSASSRTRPKVRVTQINPVTIDHGDPPPPAPEPSKGFYREANATSLYDNLYDFGGGATIDDSVLSSSSPERTYRDYAQSAALSRGSRARSSLQSLEGEEVDAVHV